MSDYDAEYNSNLETALNNSLNIDTYIDQALANSLMDININQIHNDSFSVDVLPGIFYETDTNTLFHKYYGDGILLPSKMAAVITDLDIPDIIILRFVICERERYCFIADYVDDNYAYIPGLITGDDFMPGQMIDFEIINRTITWHPATKVVLKFDCDMHGIDLRELLEPWIGKVYRCLMAGNILVLESGDKQYNVTVCNVYNCNGECDFAIAYNTDLEIEFILPDNTPQHPNICADGIKQNTSEPRKIIPDIIDTSPTPDINTGITNKLSVAELRAQRLAYFNKKS